MLCSKHGSILTVRSVQGRTVTKEAQRGTSPCDIAFALAKMAYRNGSTDDISVYVLPLDSRQRTTVDTEHTDGVALSNCGSGTPVEPLLAPETPAQRCSSEGPTLSPLGHASVEDGAFEPEAGAGGAPTKSQPMPKRDGR